MGVNAQFPINNLNGTLPIPSVAVPNAAEKASIELDYTTMSDPLLRVSLVLRLSRDNGQTWESLTSVQDVEGGKIDRHTGLPFIRYPLVNVDLPAVPNRRVDGSLTANGLTTTAFVVTTP